jgi:2-dehydro-3-deoxy-L-rhamnonate dehydrogenase (NAD+)
MPDLSRQDLGGRVAIVTGTAHGIGSAIAAALAQHGADVHGCDRDTVDVTDAKQVDELVRSIGRVDILVNNAGGVVGQVGKPLEEVSDDDWRAVVDANLTSTFVCTRAVAPGMKERGYGRIVNISSVAGKEGNPNLSAYSAAKAGVIGLTKSLGKELAKYDIAVNAITPATAKTRILDTLTKEFIEYMLVRIPRGRFVEVDEVAAMVAWLVSKENSFTTASVFDLSGGRTTY